MEKHQKEVAISVKNLAKSFKIPLDKNSGIKQAVINVYKNKKGYREFQALNDVSFEIQKGEFFGIVGRNGSGKSTLLKLLAGIYTPDKGGIAVNGSLTPFIELGVGFNPELSGRENVFLNGALLGFSRSEIEGMYEDIVDFAELHEFMEERLKNYSSGMQVRLAFSIAIQAKGDILLLDEVLAVGDLNFQAKCYEYFEELKREDRTVILVSHDANVLGKYCTKGALIEKGELRKISNIDEVINDYIEILNQEKTIEKQPSEKKSWGNKAAQVESVRILGYKNNAKVFSDKNKEIILHINYKANQDIESPVYGITITDASGVKAFTSNTQWSKIKTKNIHKNQTASVKWNIPNAFNSGKYQVSPAIASSDGSIMYHWIEGAGSFKVSKVLNSNEYINTSPDIEVSVE